MSLVLCSQGCLRTCYVAEVGPALLSALHHLAVMTTGMSHCAWLGCLCSFSLQSFQSFVYISGSNPLPAVVCKGLFTIYNSSTLSFEIPCLCVCPLLAVHRTRVGVRRQAVALALFPPCGSLGSNSGHQARQKFLYLRSHLSGPLYSLNPCSLSCPSQPKSTCSGHAPHAYVSGLSIQSEFLIALGLRA